MDKFLLKEAQKIIDQIGEIILSNNLYAIKKIEECKYLSCYSDRIIYNSQEDISVGVSGIILLLLEMYKFNHEKKYLDAIEQAATNLIIHCHSNPRSHFGFYKGRSGVAFTLIKIFEQTGSIKFLNHGSKILRNGVSSFLTSEFASNRLFDGRSGTLLVLINLYNKTQEEWILKEINICLEIITKDFLYTAKGIICNSKDKNIQSLNSFLYGSSGIAFALAEAATFFNNLDLIEVSKLISSYEDSNWNSDITNWPDFRKEINTFSDYQLHKVNFLNKNFDFFDNYCDTIGWGHGSAGICIARLNSLIKKKLHENFYFESGIRKIKNTQIKKTNIVDGLSGIGSLIIEYKKYNNQPILEEITGIIKTVIYSDILNMDDTFFNGKTGVGYFLLNAIHPEFSNSVLFPIIRKESNIKPDLLSFNFQIIAERLFEVSFPKTLHSLKTLLNKSKLIFENIESDSFLNLQSYFFSFIDSIKKLASQEKLFIKELFKYEFEKYSLLEPKDSNALIEIREICNYEKRIALKNLDEQEIINQLFIVNDGIKIINTKWNWNIFNQEIYNDISKLKVFINSKIKSKFLLLHNRNHDLIYEQKLDTFGAILLKIFQQPKSIPVAIEYCKEYFRIENQNDTYKITGYAKKYIEHFKNISIIQSFN